MFGLGLPELIVLLVFALIFFGPGKLPQVGRALGSSIREFKRATQGLADDLDEPPQKKLPPSEGDGE